LGSIWRPLAVIVIGVFVLVYGVRSVGGTEGEAEHLHGGAFVTITCDAGGKATSGPGFLSPSADQACRRARDAQRGRAPWWIGGGAAVAGVGVVQFRRARAASKK
jgi:hypothetical protein